MIVKRNSWLFRVVRNLPAWIPVGMEAVRIGRKISDDTFRVRMYSLKTWTW